MTRGEEGNESIKVRAGLGIKSDRPRPQNGRRHHKAGLCVSLLDVLAKGLGPKRKAWGRRQDAAAAGEY
jgi:hypothetical protein